MTDSGTTHPPGWHADPFGRHQFRWWDGTRWTSQVADDGQTTDDAAPLEDAGTTVRSIQNVVDKPIWKTTSTDVQAQVARAGAAHEAAGTGSLLTEPVLVVNQHAKLIEMSNEYAVYDQNGNVIGGIRQVGQSAAKKALRLLTSFDQFMTHTLLIHDTNGAPVLQVTRPSKVFKSKFIVQDAQGAEIGQIVQENVFGKIRFSLQAGGHEYGKIRAENWRAWDFHVVDHTDTEIARITKTFEGIAKAILTTADNYVVRIHRPLEDPLRSLVVASALSVDTALKQDDRGLL